MNGDPVQQRFRLRVRYGKLGRCAYLGHLEVMHSVERIVRRAGLPYAVTQGFSPRMKAAFTSALPVGTASTCEYFDVYLTDLVDAAEALERLRASSPADLMPSRAAYVDLRAPALTAAITRVGYRIELWPRDGAPAAADVRAAMADVRAQGSIPFSRGKKRKVLDLERFLVDARVGEEAGPIVLDLDTRTSNEGSLRPEVLLAALDRRLCASGLEEAPIESTGVQEYGAFARVSICRCFQCIEDGDGTLSSPLPEPAARPVPPLAAQSGQGGPEPA